MINERPRSRSPMKKRFSLIGSTGGNNTISRELYSTTSLGSIHSTSPKFGSPIPIQDDSYSSPSLLSTSGSDNDIANKLADHHVKLVCVGDGGCGKTCLMVTYCHGYFPERYVPTVFENYLSKLKAPNGKIIELALWDTAGQEEYDRLRALSYPEANVLLVCFAIDSPTSLDNVYDKWIPEITHHCPDIPFILVGLKTDLRNDLTSLQHLNSKGQFPITYEQGKLMAKKCGAYKYMECSARNNQGVNDIFNNAISLVINKHRIPSKHQPSHQLQLQHEQKKNRNNTHQQYYDSHTVPLNRKRKSKCIIL
jgi:small GTP-binding protein